MIIRLTYGNKLQAAGLGPCSALSERAWGEHRGCHRGTERGGTAAHLSAVVRIGAREDHPHRGRKCLGSAAEGGAKNGIMISLINIEKAVTWVSNCFFYVVPPGNEFHF